MNTKAIIKGWMITADIAGLQELANVTGISYGTLKLRMRIPQEFRVRELNAIREATDMTEEDYTRLCVAAGEGR